MVLFPSICSTDVKMRQVHKVSRINTLNTLFENYNSEQLCSRITQLPALLEIFTLGLKKKYFEKFCLRSGLVDIVEKKKKLGRYEKNLFFFSGWCCWIMNDVPNQNKKRNKKRKKRKEKSLVRWKKQDKSGTNLYLLFWPYCKCFWTFSVDFKNYQYHAAYWCVPGYTT